VDVRTRTRESHTVTLQLSASGSAQLTDSKGASRSLRVPAESTATAIVRVRGAGAGTGVLDVVLTDAASAVADRVPTNGRSNPRERCSQPRNGSATVPLTAAAAQVRLEISSSAVLARIERSLFRPFKQPLASNQSPLHLELAVSNPPIAQSPASLQVSLRHDLGRGVPVVVRIPLPPGASLAEPISGVRQVQGALTLRSKLDSDSLPRVIIVPLHFSLSGTITLPEATGRVDDEEFASARTPARPLLILPRRR